MHDFVISHGVRKVTALRARFLRSIEMCRGMLVLGFALTVPAQAATFTVNSTGDSADAAVNGVCESAVAGECTLRAAIEEANADAALDTIAFNIPGNGPHTISPASALPIITQPVFIDGYTEAGASADSSGTANDGSDAVLQIVLNGSVVGPSALDIDGLHITGGGSTVRGLVINNWDDDGIKLTVGDTNIIEGNYLGTNAAGASALPNGDDGIDVDDASVENQIISNLISGNADDGVSLGNGSLMTGTDDNLIQGNIIGTDATGASAVPNGGNGVDLEGLTDDNDILDNIISGNGGDGVNITGFRTNSTLIQGNFIGTDATGAGAVANGDDGVELDDGTVLNDILDNVISGNGDDGVFIIGPSTDFNVIQGNFIGTDATGSNAVPNGDDGVELQSGVHDNFVGGAAPGDANIIANNGRAGVAVTGSDSTRNEVLSNAIYNNVGLGIDLGGDGVTPNDAGDTDTGPNNFQNFPDLTSAVTSGGSTTVQGSLSSTPGNTYRIEFFANDACDPSGFGEGQEFLGVTSVTTSAGGNPAVFSFPTSSPVAVGRFITATASQDPFGIFVKGSSDLVETSEFSACEAVVTGSAAGSLQFSAGAFSAGEGDNQATITISRTGGSSGQVSVEFSTAGGTAMPGSDFTTTSTTVTFADGDSSPKIVTVPIADDSQEEGNESVNLTLSNPTGGATLGSPGSATLTIVDNDQAQAEPAVPIPALGLMGLWLMALLIPMAGWRRLRKHFAFSNRRSR